MSTGPTAVAPRAGESRPSAVPVVRGAGTWLMLASWTFALGGVHALLTMLEDVMAGGSAWPVWAYGIVAALSLAGTYLLHRADRWAYFAAVVAAAVAGFAVFPLLVGGFAIFAVVELAFLGLGYRGAGTHEAVQLASAHVPWGVKLLVVYAAIAIALGRVFLALDFDLEWIGDNAVRIVTRGLPLTLWISVLAIALAIVMALLGALARLSKNPVSFGVAGFYTSFFRGTPLLVQIFLIYFGVAEVGVRMRGTSLEGLGEILQLGTVAAAVLAIGLNYGAYMTEIFRAGIQSVGHGQAEAADALGMTYGQKMRRVVLPQAVRVIIPPTGNEFIAMTKDSSLAFTIGALEVFRRADLAGREDFRSLEAFILAAGVYWIFTGVLTFFQARLERKMGRGYTRGVATKAPAKAAA